jgi:hypothetical protein
VPAETAKDPSGHFVKTERAEKIEVDLVIVQLSDDQALVAVKVVYSSRQ